MLPRVRCGVFRYPVCLEPDLTLSTLDSLLLVNPPYAATAFSQPSRIFSLFIFRFLNLDSLAKCQCLVPRIGRPIFLLSSYEVPVFSVCSSLLSV